MDGSRSWSRRNYLRRGGTIIAGVLAGCLSGDDSRSTISTTQPTTSSPPSSPTTSPSHCAGSQHRTPMEIPVQYDTLSGFALTTNKEIVQQGGRLIVTLENISDTVQESGNSSKYDIHHRTDGSWVTIFHPSQAIEETPAILSNAVKHPPSEGFRWDLTLTRDGLGHEIDHGSGYLAVCSPIGPGTYRFVYWGVGEESDLAVRFTVTES